VTACIFGWLTHHTCSKSILRAQVNSCSQLLSCMHFQTCLQVAASLTSSRLTLGSTSMLHCMLHDCLAGSCHSLHARTTVRLLVGLTSSRLTLRSHGPWKGALGLAGSLLHPSASWSAAMISSGLWTLGGGSTDQAVGDEQAAGVRSAICTNASSRQSCAMNPGLHTRTVPGTHLNAPGGGHWSMVDTGRAGSRHTCRWRLYSQAGE
jgi:hypothetical protein